MSFSIPIDTGMIDEMLAGIKRQIPFIKALALTGIAKAVQQAETAAIDRHLSNPTPFTRQAVGITPATKSSLLAMVFLKDRQAKYLAPEINGGKRQLKGFELKLGSKTRTAYLLPGEVVPLDAHGNLSYGWIGKLMADLNRADAGARYFVGQPLYQPEMPESVYRRTIKPNGERGIAPLLVFSDNAVYTRRLPWEETARRTINEVALRELNKAMTFAKKTAR